MSSERTSCVSCNGTGDLGGDFDLGACPDCDGVGTVPAPREEERDMVAWLRRASQTVYLATDTHVADDISPRLKRAAEIIERLSKAPCPIEEKALR